MRDQTVLFFLAVLVVVLFLIILYQRFAFRTGIQTTLRQINEKLEEIVETDSEEKVMIFTDNPVLMDLGAQIDQPLAGRTAENESRLPQGGNFFQKNAVKYFP